MQKPETRLLITSLAPEPVHHHGKTGGGVRLGEILRRLEKRNGVDILCVSTLFNRKFFEKSGVRAEFRIVKSNLKFKSLAGLCLKSLFIIAKALLVLKKDFLKSEDKNIVIYASSDLFWETIPAYFFKIRNKNARWIQTIYHIYPDWKKRPGKKAVNFFGHHLQRFSFWLIKKRADKIVLINNIVKNDLVKIGFPENKLFVSSCGIDMDYFENLEKSASAYDGVFLARLSHSKGISDLVEIWKKVCAELPEARLAVIGGGSEETKNFLSGKTSKYGLEKNIDLLGYLENEKAYPILKSGKVFLVPSHEEGWGIAIAEAMACGLPVVSWNLPAFQEVFGDKTMQIEENNIDLFSKKIIALLKNEAERERIGKIGEEFAKKYSWERVAERELEIFTG